MATTKPLFYRRENKTMAYRRWHYCKNCRSWPIDDYEDVVWEPPAWDVCEDCKRLDARGNCSAGANSF